MHERNTVGTSVKALGHVPVVVTTTTTLMMTTMTCQCSTARVDGASRFAFQAARFGNRFFQHLLIEFSANLADVAGLLLA